MLTGACAHASRPKVLIGPRTKSFRVLYHVTANRRADPNEVQWEVLTLRRPFSSSDLVFTQRPDLHAADIGVPLSGTMNDADHLYTIAGARMRLVSGRQPGLPTGDQALLEVATDALAAKLVRVEGRSRIIGRPCTRLVFVEPPVGAIAPLGTGADHDEVCVDPGGIVLHERWTLGGKVVQERTAVEITAAPADAFDTSGVEDLPPSARGPYTTALDKDTKAPPTPKGYRLAVSANFFFPRTDEPTQLAYASKVWAFAKGANVITVEAGAGAVQPWDVAREKPLQLGTRRAARIVRSDGTEVHWSTGTSWVRVRGSLGLAALLPYAVQVSRADSSPAAVPK